MTTTGVSPDSAIPHLMAEFELSINSAGSANPAGGHEGVYDPAPAFWSASKGSTTPGGDPPISSGIFTLNPDGSTTVVPVFGFDGAPIQVLPEPASLAVLALGGLTLLRRARRV